MKSRAVLPKRILEKINFTESCWLWTASKIGNGYGCINFNGRNQRAHRVVYIILVGDIPENKMLCHTCDTRLCVNPKHLYVGDNSTNQKDRVVAGNHWASTRTHCPSGHEYSGDNLIVYKNGFRLCRSCNRKTSLEWYHKNKSKLKGDTQSD